MEDNKTEKALTKVEKKKEKIKKAFHKFFDAISKKWLIKGTTTLLLFLVIIAIYIGVTAILDKVTLPEIDCTKDKMYSLSEETKTKVKSIDEELTITLINFSKNQDLKDIVEKYKALNKNIKVIEVDNLEARADLINKYSLTTDSSLIVVEYKEREKTLNSYNLFTYDYSTYEQIDTTEEALTNAIVDVTNEEKEKVYFINNHNLFQEAAFATIEQAIKDDANEVEYIDLLTTGKVPDDCDLFVITTLKEDITKPEKDYIVDYINRGGKILFLCGETSKGDNLPNFNEILALYGISLEGGTIFEGVSSKMLPDNPDIIVEDLENDSLTNNINMSLKVALVDATPITINEEKLEELAVEYETLITTSSSSFVRTNFNILTSSRTSFDSEESSYTVGVLATKTIDENTKSKIIVYSNGIFATDTPIQIGDYTYPLSALYNNSDVVANSVLYLNEKQDIITIRKNYDTVTFTTTQAQQTIVKLIIFMIPTLIILSGIFIWLIRRRKQ